MERRTFSDGRVKGNFDIFLVSFWVDSVTCFSRDADKLCVPVHLTFLSALLLLSSCLLLVCPRRKFRGERGGENVVFYCFLGNLCSTVGAILSRQLHIQVFMGAFAAVTDAVSCIMCCLPAFLCWNSTAQKKRRMMRRRRRQHLLAVGVLMVVAGGFLKSRITEPSAMRPVRGRRLLGVLLQVSSWCPLMDNNEILGYVLGLLSLVIACTSRFPALCRARRGQKLSWAHIFSRLLCSLSGALYTAAILLHSTQFEFLMRVMPWLLSSIGCVSLDLLILFITWCKRATRVNRSIRFSPDTESLLGDPDVHTDDPVAMKLQRKQQIPSSTTKTKNIQKMTEMGHYMDVSVPPARKQKSLKEVMLSAEGVKDGPQHKMVRVIQVDSLGLSDTSYDSSPLSSDLEWDFGAAISQWSKPAVNPQEGDEFPLQDWPTNPKPLSICMHSMSEPPQKTLSAAAEAGSVLS